MGSSWNEHGHPNPPEKPTGLTLVHTCVSCFERKLTRFAGDGNKERRIVPEGCPRWDEHSGSGLDCDDCLRERMDLRRADPRYASALAASGRMMESMFAQIRAKVEDGQNVVPLDAVRDQKEAVTDFVVATMPIPEDAKVEDYQGTMRLLEDLLYPIWADTTFESERERHKDEWSIVQHMFHWVQGLHFALQRHTNPVAIAHEWMLVFTDQPLAARTWSRWPIPFRKALIQRWVEILDPHPVQDAQVMA